MSTSSKAVPLAETPGDAVLPGPGQRLVSVDLLRGLVMIVMVLDHVREFFGEVRLDPTDLSRTTVPLFLTRWVTHFCAPVFVLLAGTGAYLARGRFESRRGLAAFLLTRGLWLIVLEITVARFGLTFDPTFQFIPLVVLWAIGLSMVVLSALVFLPTPAIAAFGVVLIAGHNLLDGFGAEPDGIGGILWRVLHVPGPLGSVSGRTVFCLYPLVPWVGVMAAGYALGAVFRMEGRRRRVVLLGLGLAMSAAFVVLRTTNVYGDPRPWSMQKDLAFTALSFLNCAKYPPSLLFLLMTLGPALVALALLERGAGWVGRRAVTLGRVPLFFYLLQWYVLHVAALLVAWASGEPSAWLLGKGPFDAPPGYGHSLPFIYAMWAVILLLLYPPSAWFAGLKRRSRATWLSYF